MATLMPDTDSEDELPIGWEERATPDGLVYYANHADETTQWTHPKTGRRKRLTGELPFGWERTVEPDGTILFIDHMSKKTTFTDPRLAFAVEEKEDGTDVRQQFDSSSTGLQVLHGKDLRDKVAVVTGGNSGIGFETCRALALHGAQVIMACRNLDHARQQIDKILSERREAQVTAMHLDLSSFESVRRFAHEVESLDTAIHMLILNAGVFALPHELTRDGFERTFQVNHLSHFLLVRLLEKRLLTSAPSRVIVVSSESHRQSFLTKENISPEYLSPRTSSRFVPLMAYNDSKLCNVLFASQLNKRLSRHNVSCNSLHPGNMVSTGISRNWWFYRLLFAVVRPFTKSAEQASATTVYVAVDSEVESMGGGLYFNNCCRCTPSKSGQDGELAEKLWTLSEDMVAAATLT